MANLTPDPAVLVALAARFDNRFTPEEVRSYLLSAADELRTSVQAETLPEMSIRLAALRMERAARDAAH